jgi:hypothetical protein
VGGRRNITADEWNQIFKAKQKIRMAELKHVATSPSLQAPAENKIIINGPYSWAHVEYT